MDGASFRFHGGLNDFLPRTLREKTFFHEFTWRASIKDMVESLGPPHCEVQLLVMDGVSVDFDAIVKPGAQIEVYDDLSARDDLPEMRLLRPPLVDRPRFVLDAHLGRLSSYLRMIGFDTLYRNDYDDDELAIISHTEGRVLLSRDIGLLKRSLVVYGYFIRQTSPRDRLLEVMRRFQLSPWVVPFKHCLKCNGALQEVEKAAILDQLTATTATHYNEFHRCQHCGQIYWKGSHYEQMRAFLSQVLENELS
ncbi:MAG: Mut7-C RNAse domain-containing protein [Anaerolineae bacterium]